MNHSLPDLATRCQCVAAAVIEQAACDFRNLVAWGYISKGEALPTKRHCRGAKPAHRHRQYLISAKDLCYFFREGGAMEWWIGTAMLRVNAAAIRSKLFAMEAPAQ